LKLTEWALSVKVANITADLDSTRIQLDAFDHTPS